jgi:excinuclease ABC subunit B
VAILDADKEGFLRNGRSLIQTIGRAALNVSGEVIMYADRVTDSMAFAIDETNRRREKQIAYNTAHGIEPQTIRKAIADIVQYMHEGESQLTTAAEAAKELAKMPRDEVMRLITTLEEDMAHAAESLDFEAAARLRDQAVKLRSEIESSTTDEVLERLKKGARRGSEYGRRKRR